MKYLQPHVPTQSLYIIRPKVGSSLPSYQKLCILLLEQLGGKSPLPDPQLLPPIYSL